MWRLARHAWSASNCSTAGRTRLGCGCQLRSVASGGVQNSEFRKLRVAVGMSGGVDSTVAAILLKDAGHKVIGVFMRNWDELDEAGACTSEAEYHRVQVVCSRLGIECLQVDYIKEYWNSVFSEILTGYTTGLTPNPDVLCNRHIKFGHFLQEATERLGVDCVATGHYARITADSNGHPALARGADRSKDQAYFLAGLPSSVLARVLFPIGHMAKEDVKALARSRGFKDIAAQKESMGICFIGKRNFRSFLQEYVENKPGPIVVHKSEKKCELHRETHDGLHLFTIGQRALLSGMSARCFVAAKDLEHNTLHIVQGGDHVVLKTAAILARDVRWTSDSPPPCGSSVHIQFRHLQAPFVGRVRLPTQTPRLTPRCLPKFIGNVPNRVFDKEWGPLSNDEVEIRLDEQAVAVTPGQAVVMYDMANHVCLGSASIVDTAPTMQCQANVQWPEL